jgi:hypothetical protein
MKEAQMGSPARLSFAVGSATLPYRSMSPHSETAVPPSIYTDLTLARVARANLLVVGPERMVTNLLGLVLGDLHTGVTLRRNGLLHLPAAVRHAGTVVIRDADTLTMSEQLDLLQWLDSAPPRAQVISTAAQPLLPRVEAGDFSALLYYRLNTIYIDLAE